MLGAPRSSISDEDDESLAAIVPYVMNGLLQLQATDVQAKQEANTAIATLKQAERQHEATLREGERKHEAELAKNERDVQLRLQTGAMVLSALFLVGAFSFAIVRGNDTLVMELVKAGLCALGGYGLGVSKGARRKAMKE